VIELPGAGGVDLVLQPRELLRGLVRVVHGQLVEAIQQVLHVADAVLDVLADRLVLVQVGFLLEESDGGAGRELSLPAEVLVLAGHDAQQGGLTCPVQTEDADLGAGVEAERDFLQHRFIRWMGPAQLVHRVDVRARHRPMEVRSRPSGEFTA